MKCRDCQIVLYRLLFVECCDLFICSDGFFVVMINKARIWIYNLFTTFTSMYMKTESKALLISFRKFLIFTSSATSQKPQSQNLQSICYLIKISIHLGLLCWRSDVPTTLCLDPRVFANETFCSRKAQVFRCSSLSVLRYPKQFFMDPLIVVPVSKWIFRGKWDTFWGILGKNWP